MHFGGKHEQIWKAEGMGEENHGRAIKLDVPDVKAGLYVIWWSEFLLIKQEREKT